jgi:hypothetical protein
LTLPVLIILAVLWAVVLLPPLFRARTQRSADSIVDFNHKLDVLGRTNGGLDDPAALSQTPPGALTRTPRLAPRILAAPMTRTTAAQRSARRRRDVTRALMLSVIVTLLLAYAAGSSALWALQIFVDVIAAAYLGLWAWMRSVQLDRLSKVRYMPELRVPELRLREITLRRSASS